MLPPETLITFAGSGLGAGPATTAPVVMLNWLPWHGQSIVPLLTWLTVHPMWVQTALNALNSPDVGWVTTTCCPEKTIPLPTGIWLVVVSALPAAAPLAGALPDGAPLGAPPDGAPPDGAPLGGAAGLDAALPAAVLLLEAPLPQAVIALARPTRPTPASTPRRVVGESVCGSCVTTAPIRMGCR
jgi:hypothetical protein